MQSNRFSYTGITCSGSQLAIVLQFCTQSFPDQEGKSDGTETTANLNQKLYFHKLGTDQSQDVLCAEWPDNPNWMG